MIDIIVLNIPTTIIDILNYSTHHKAFHITSTLETISYNINK